MKLTHTKITLGRGKNYVVVHDAEGVIRIEYNNAVTGRRPIFLNGRVGRAVIKQFKRMGS